MAEHAPFICTRIIVRILPTTWCLVTWASTTTVTVRVVYMHDIVHRARADLQHFRQTVTALFLC